MAKNILSPSILAADFLNLGKQIKQLDEVGVEYIHIDIMDGDFVPEISFANPIISAIRPITDIFFDVHLMLSHPLKQIDSYVRDGAQLITIHVEALDDIDETLDKIHSLGIVAGISIKPDTSVEAILPYLDKVELILVMSVEPGFAGQGFIESSLDKIREIRKIIDTRGLDIDLEVDGGIKIENVEKVLEAGANVIVVGSGLFAGDVEVNSTKLMKILKDKEE